MIKKSNQEFITLNEPMIYFYLIDVIFFVHTGPCYQCIYQNIILKIKMEKASLEDLKILIFHSF